jgi:hypothetical protein
LQKYISPLRSLRLCESKYLQPFPIASPGCTDNGNLYFLIQ